MEWNAENQLTRVTKNAVEQARFKYDPLGRRVEKVAGGVTTLWTYDAEDIFREANGSSTLKYVQGPGTDEPVATDDGSALSYFQADGLGSVVKTTNAVGSVTLARQYDAWGDLQAGGTTNGYAFTGREWDSETSLHYYRARYYDTRIGRFMSEDPLGFSDGPNRYSYVRSNPIRFTDPSGLAAFGFGGGAGGTAIYVPGLMGPIGDSNCVAVIDTHGDIGLMCCTGVGGGYGESVGVEAQLTGLFCPGCDSICDLPGFYVQFQFGASAGGGVNGGGGGSLSSSSAVGIVTAGVSGGGGGYAGVTGGNCELVTSTKDCKTCTAK